MYVSSSNFSSSERFLFSGYKKVMQHEAEAFLSVTLRSFRKLYLFSNSVLIFESNQSMLKFYNKNKFKTRF